jgi:hypothetical protein
MKLIVKSGFCCFSRCSYTCCLSEWQDCEGRCDCLVFYQQGLRDTGNRRTQTESSENKWALRRPSWLYNIDNALDQRSTRWWYHIQGKISGWCNAWFQSTKTYGGYFFFLDISRASLSDRCLIVFPLNFNLAQVFSGFFPINGDLYNPLRSAIEKLCLNDSSVSIQTDSSPALGQGFRLGFLGLLHMEVFGERLENEFSQQVIVTSPNLPYKVKLCGDKIIKHHGTDELIIYNPCNVSAFLMD